MKHTAELESLMQIRSRELEESEIKYLHIFHNIPDCILIFDPKTYTILDVNKSALEMFGYTREEILSMKIVDLAEDPQKTTEIIPLLIQQTHYHIPCQYYKTKKGTRIPMDIHYGTLHLGDKLWAFKIMRDISESLHAEETLRFHVRILEHMTDWVTALDSQGRITYVSSSIEKLLGFSPQEFIGKTYQEIYSVLQIRGFPVEQFKAVLQGHSWEGEASYITRNGTHIQASIHMGSMYDDQGHLNGAIWVARDITSLKQLENQLQQSQKIQAVGQLAGGISHDFNNLLTGILGNIRLAFNRGNEDILPFLQNAEIAAHRAADLVKQLLAFSRKSEIDLSLTDVNEVIDEVYNLARHTIDRRIDIHVDKEEELSPILSDRAQLITMLMNLCVNARDAIEDILLKNGYPERANDRFYISIQTQSIHVSSAYCKRHADAKPGHYILITVADNGIGMSKEVQNHVFEPFFTTKDVDKGTGLGLSSVYGTVKQHNGWLEMQSEWGVGSTFYLYFPVSETGMEEDFSLLTSVIPGGTETILIVDDESIIRNLGKSILEPEGYSVLLASDGQDALNCIQAQADEIDLILLDISMPKQSGYEVFRELQSSYPDIKIIICSGYSQSEEVPPIFDSIPKLSKPFYPHKLLKKIREVLDQG